MTRSASPALPVTSLPGAVQPHPRPVAAVLFDRDGTLVEDVPYNGDGALVVARPGAVEAVVAARMRGRRVGVVTNQSGVGRGLVTAEAVHRVNAAVDELLGPFEYWGVCPHGPEKGCTCRKPAPGLVLEACARFRCSPDEVVVVGDRVADVGAARAAGALVVLVPSPCTDSGAAEMADHVLTSLADLAPLLERLERVPR